MKLVQIVRQVDQIFIVPNALNKLLKIYYAYIKNMTNKLQKADIIWYLQLNW